jgi:pimeloyl-ACP methyl ester carboxylesterase
VPRRGINGCELYYELVGEGEPIVLVHGNWVDHSSWMLATAELSADHRVLTYDRRGHSRSERLAGPAPRRVDEDDLATLIELLGLAPAHLVANSYGASISLGLAARRPELVASVVAHEPPLVAIDEPIMNPVWSSLERVFADLRAGRLEDGAARFVEELVLGPGAWMMLPEQTQRVMVANAPMFLAMADDPCWAAVPPPSPSVPVLLTDGDASPAWLPAVTRALARGPLVHATRHTFAGAGHVPHLTHVSDFVRVVEVFTTDQRGAQP